MSSNLLLSGTIRVGAAPQKVQRVIALGAHRLFHTAGHLRQVAIGHCFGLFALFLATISNLGVVEVSRGFGQTHSRHLPSVCMAVFPRFLWLIAHRFLGRE